MVRHKAQPRSSDNRCGNFSSLSRTTDDSSDEELQQVRIKPRRNRVEREIRALRRSAKLIIPRAPFIRIVRDIVEDIFPRLDIRRFQVRAIEALQEAVEMYIVQYYEEAFLLTYHANRSTLMQRDMVMLRRLRGHNDVINR
ncbi:histone H3.3-like type 1 [Leptopilina heterotoma]|uniref:histone H3.3-like type 1 n=1 Tax=Leptopilina heterotoma TaxID=63436 RepID=UPI001CA8B70B|nr:histone H3.3-like type 1 [Leptopilina heterotoma]